MLYSKPTKPHITDGVLGLFSSVVGVYSLLVTTAIGIIRHKSTSVMSRTMPKRLPCDVLGMRRGRPSTSPESPVAES